jgi:hypothetical protein
MAKKIIKEDNEMVVQEDTMIKTYSALVYIAIDCTRR